MSSQDQAIGVVLLGLFLFSGRRSRKSASPKADDFAEPQFTGGTRFWKLVSPEFRQELTRVAEKLGFDPDDLMTMVRIERGTNKKGTALGSGLYSKYTLSEKAADKYTNGQRTFESKDGFSYGLFGIQPATAYWLGTTPAALKDMSDIEQIAFIQRYFEKHGWGKGQEHDITKFPRWGAAPPGELTQFDAMYSGVWGGQSMIDAPLSAVLIDREKDPENYERNKDADYNQDGKITKKDVLTIARKFRRMGTK